MADTMQDNLQGILIESQWNLNKRSDNMATARKLILIESQWNLNADQHPEESIKLRY